MAASLDEMKKKIKNLNYSKAKKVIAGGTMLFSKKPELYSPDYWPTYFGKAKILLFGHSMGKNIWICILV